MYMLLFSRLGCLSGHKVRIEQTDPKTTTVLTHNERHLVVTYIPISPATFFRDWSSSAIDPDRSINTYKSRGRFLKGVTVILKERGSPVREGEMKGEVEGRREEEDKRGRDGQREKQKKGRKGEKLVKC